MSGRYAPEIVLSLDYAFRLPRRIAGEIVVAPTRLKGNVDGSGRKAGHNKHNKATLLYRRNCGDYPSCFECGRKDCNWR